jgi:hypothetical protein
VLAGVAGLRGGKAVHPSGVVHRARLVIDGAGVAPRGSTLLDDAATWPALGWLNRLRDFAYPLSQAAWGRRGGQDHRQLLADHQVDELAKGSVEAA